MQPQHGQRVALLERVFEPASPPASCLQPARPQALVGDPKMGVTRVENGTAPIVKLCVKLSKFCKIMISSDRVFCWIFNRKHGGGRRTDGAGGTASRSLAACGRPAPRQLARAPGGPSTGLRSDQPLPQPGCQIWWQFEGQQGPCMVASQAQPAESLFGPDTLGCTCEVADMTKIHLFTRSAKMHLFFY